jgi:hypothetical protein
LNGKIIKILTAQIRRLSGKGQPTRTRGAAPQAQEAELVSEDIKYNEKVLQEVALNLINARKIIVLAGAGISTNFGIPVSLLNIFYLL